MNGAEEFNAASRRLSEMWAAVGVSDSHHGEERILDPNEADRGYAAIALHMGVDVEVLKEFVYRLGGDAAVAYELDEAEASKFFTIIRGTITHALMTGWLVREEITTGAKA